MFVETQLPNGGTITEWVSPPIAPTHKIKGLSATEYRNLLTLTEQIRNDKARTHIDGDLAWLSGSVEPDDDAAAIGFAELLIATFCALFLNLLTMQQL